MATYTFRMSLTNYRVEFWEGQPLLCSCDDYCFCPRCEWERARSLRLRRQQDRELLGHVRIPFRSLFTRARRNPGT